MSDNCTKILSIGMVSTIGLFAMQNFASVRGGVSKFAETSIYDKQFNPFVMSILPDNVLPPLEESVENEIGLTSRQIRMLKLATYALDEALTNITDISEIPLFLGGPEPIPDRPPPINEHFISLLSQQTKKSFAQEKSRLFPEGHAAGLSAIKAAIDSIESGEEPFVLVGGIDTFLDLYLLATMDMENRVLSPSVMDGFIPGEGAAFLLLGKPNSMGGSALTPYANIVAASTGFEKGHRYSDEPYKGDGLSETFDELFSQDKASGKIKTVYAGLNGENFGAKEWGVAYLRHKDQFEENHRFEHPVDCFGDPGAALGPLMIGLAAIGLSKNTINGPCLVWCSSDYGQRAALILDNA